MISLTLTNGKTDYELIFDLVDIPIAHRWLQQVKVFVAKGQPWDDPTRFYNFPTTPWNYATTAAYIQKLCNTINQHSPGLIEVPVSETISQDTLNYLHNIFEKYHGLYNQQSTNEFYSTSPVEVQRALGELNIWIHRYETLGGIPRFVMTWSGTPVRQPIQPEDFQHFKLQENWGDLRLNYCEIGKTLYDLWHDNDSYISDTAFRPQHWFSFDFTVRFSDLSQQYFDQTEEAIWHYFKINQDKFNRLGYYYKDPKLSLGSITVAKLRITTSKQEILDNIDQHQLVKSIAIH